MLQWSFDSVVPGDRGYDSVVYRLPAPDGRWVLLSTKSVNSTAYVSHDLYEWAPATAAGDEGLNVLTGEGESVFDLHVRCSCSFCRSVSFFATFDIGIVVARMDANEGLHVADWL